MDGYAVRAADTKNAGEWPAALRVTGTAYAGDQPIVLAARAAVGIATGAPLPAGADAVVPIERVRHVGGDAVVSEPLRPGDSVFLPGDDAKRGEVLARPGDFVTPGRAALLAAAGHAHVGVYRKPRVTVVCTGDELVAVSERPGPGQIRNSNATMIAAHLIGDGAEVLEVVQVADEIGLLRSTLERVLATSDLLITTGGASVGERDLVKSAFVTLGGRFAFRSVALRPAKPAAFARAGRTLIAVLPGNPAAAFVGYVALARGVVRRLAGHRVAFPAPVTATLRGTIRAKADRHFILFGRVERDGAGFSVVPLDNQCSSLVRTSADANGLIIVPPGSPNLAAGAMVDVEIFDWDALGNGAHGGSA
jgi:molybdopterin molybdotransferase